MNHAMNRSLAVLLSMQTSWAAQMCDGLFTTSMSSTQGTYSASPYVSDGSFNSLESANTLPNSP